MDGILSGLNLCTLEEAIKFAALQYQVRFGDYTSQHALVSTNNTSNNIANMNNNNGNLNSSSGSSSSGGSGNSGSSSLNLVGGNWVPNDAEGEFLQK